MLLYKVEVYSYPQTSEQEEGVCLNDDGCWDSWQNTSFLTYHQIAGLKLMCTPPARGLIREQGVGHLSVLPVRGDTISKAPGNALPQPSLPAKWEAFGPVHLRESEVFDPEYQSELQLQLTEEVFPAQP